MGRGRGRGSGCQLSELRRVRSSNFLKRKDPTIDVRAHAKLSELIVAIHPSALDAVGILVRNGERRVLQAKFELDIFPDCGGVWSIRRSEVWSKIVVCYLDASRFSTFREKRVTLSKQTIE